MATFGLFAIPVAAELDVDSVALAFGTLSLVSGFAAPAVGSLVDRYGLRMVQRSGALLLVLGLLLSAGSTKAWHYYIAMGILCGIGVTAFTQLPVNVLVANNVRKRLLPAFGLVTAGAGIGALVVLPATEQTISQIGWRPAYGIYALAVSVVWLAFDRWLGSNVDDRGQRRSRSDPIWSALLERWRVTRPELQVVLAAACSGAQRTLVVAFFIPWSVHRGYSLTTAAQVFGIAEGLRAFGGVGISWLGSRFGSLMTYVATTVTAAVVVALLVVADNEVSMLYLLAAAYGVASGGIHPASSSLQSQVYRRDHLGMLFGASSAAYGLGGAVSVAAARAIQTSFGLDGVMWLIVAGLLGMAALIIGVRSDPALRVDQPERG